MTSFESKAARVIDNFNGINLNLLEVQNQNVVGIHGSLGHCGQIRKSSTFQYGSQNVEEVSNTR